jgi:Flp pilus assembly protein TadG
MQNDFKKMRVKWKELDSSRRGVFLVVGAICLIVALTFIAFTIDLGIASLTKTQMQNAVDASALAAAMEITDALAHAGSNVSNVFTYAQDQAKAKAASVANMNHVYVDPSKDVKFGRRYYNSTTKTYTIDWNAGATQVNVVKVIARRDNTTKSAPDAKVPTVFAGAFSNGTTLKTEAVAFIDPRDIVVVHDFSRSMNFDSYFSDETTSRLTQAQIESNTKLVYDDLQPLNLGTMQYTPVYMSASQTNTGATATVTFKGTSVAVTSNTAIKSVKIYFSTGSSTQTFSISNETTKTGNWTGTGSNAGKRIKQVDLTIRKVGSSSQTWSLTNYAYNTTTITSFLGLTNVTYPYASGSWANYISFVQSNGGLSDYGYLDKYGGMTFMCYLMREVPSHAQTKDLWKTRHYPFHAIKEGHELLCSFLTDLGYDDHLGMVSYDTNHRVETTISETGLPSVNIASTPITKDYESVRKLMAYKQAAHYSSSTNMGGGLTDAITLLNTYKRDGSRPAIILMTDGNSNTIDSGVSTALPTGWNWNTLFDYDGNGTADFTTSDSQAQYVLKKVKEAVDKGYTVHAISVGVDADRDLLRAVAFLGNGYYVDVPGGSSVTDMESQVRDAFTKIAAAVPPARLVPSN